MQLIERDVLHRSGFAVSEDHGLTHKLGPGLLELTKDRGRAQLYNLA